MGEPWRAISSFTFEPAEPKLNNVMSYLSCALALFFVMKLVTLKIFRPV